MNKIKNALFALTLSVFFAGGQTPTLEDAIYYRNKGWLNKAADIFQRGMEEKVPDFIGLSAVGEPGTDSWKPPAYWFLNDGIQTNRGRIRFFQNGTTNVAYYVEARDHRYSYSSLYGMHVSVTRYSLVRSNVLSEAEDTPYQLQRRYIRYADSRSTNSFASLLPGLKLTPVIQKSLFSFQEITGESDLRDILDGKKIGTNESGNVIFNLRTLGPYKLPTEMWVLPRIQGRAAGDQSQAKSDENTLCFKFEFTAKDVPELLAFESREFYSILNQMQDSLKKTD